MFAQLIRSACDLRQLRCSLKEPSSFYDFIHTLLLEQDLELWGVLRLGQGQVLQLTPANRWVLEVLRNLLNSA